MCAFFWGSPPCPWLVAIFFVSPFIICAFSVLFLGETVGLRRWMAIFAGFSGVMFVLRPGTEAFEMDALFPLSAALGYAALHMFTRRLGKTESAACLAFYVQLTFVVTSILVGGIVGNGKFDVSSDASLAFLLREWTWPSLGGLGVMALVGAATAIGGFANGQAYRLSEAAFVAPFEYMAMPVSIISGFFIFRELPDRWALLGIALIITSGLFLIWRTSVATWLHDRLAPQRR